MKMKVAIVGAGPSGLCAIKNCISEGFKVVAFEQTSEVGGEWNSNLEVGLDVHSKIYEGLQTNFTKELMEFSDFSYDKDETASYLSPDKVQHYFLNYTEKFGLRKLIKFNHKVINIRPIEDQWEILTKNLKTQEYSTTIADKVFVCVGISTPRIPKIENQKDFQGTILHSRDFRTSEMFKDKKVLLIGSGSSAVDMVIAIDKVAERIVWVNKIKQSHGKPMKLGLSNKTIDKSSPVKKFTKTGAEFEDGSFEEFDIIAFATGYDFTFPFLSVDSGISVYDKCVQPLYKQCINANRPSLAIIGIPLLILNIPMFELQIKFCLQYWSGRKNLPTKTEMLMDIKKDFQNRNVDLEKDCHRAHCLGLRTHENYYNDLAQTAEIQPIKPVLIKICNHVIEKLFEDFQTFRLYRYKILNDFEFLAEYKNGIKA